jgi:hypothetical protein
MLVCLVSKHLQHQQCNPQWNRNGHFLIFSQTTGSTKKANTQPKDKCTLKGINSAEKQKKDE